MNKSKASWLGRLKVFFHIEPKNHEQFTASLRRALDNSIIDAETLAMLEGVILFSQMKARDVMLPKKQMICIPEDTEFEEILDIVTKTGHSRFPIMNDTKDQVIGILHSKDLLRFQSKAQHDFDILDLAREATIIPESKSLNSLLTEFRRNRNHMAIVVDEYGVVCGFVTLEDLIEQIIGDIEDEFDIDEETYIKAHNNVHYIIKAYTPIEEFNKQLHAHFSDESYDTIGGIVMANFGYLPQRGEVITIDQFEFKILHADMRGIKLLECFDRRLNS